MVVSIVTHLLFTGLKLRASRTSVEEVGTEYRDVISHTEVRSSSLRRMGQRIVLKEEVAKKLIENEPVKLQELKNKSSNHGPFISYDITAHLNDLSIQLQGKGELVYQLFTALKPFMMILKLFTSHLSKLEICHFPSFAHRIAQRRHAQLGEKYVKISTVRQIDLLRGEFVCRRTLQGKLVEGMDPEEVPLH